MSQPLVLSLFPGVDLLGMAFEQEGFCVVQGPDVIFGRDVRDFHPPAGRFDGVIGGPPCKGESNLAKLNGRPGESMAGEFWRVVREADPVWYVMEAVLSHGAIWTRCQCCEAYQCRLHRRHAFECACPEIAEWGNLSPYVPPHVTALSPRWLGEEQSRKRYFHSNLPLAPHIEVVTFEPVAFSYAVRAANRRGAKGTVIDGQASYSLVEMKRLQGLPEDFTLPGFTVRGQEEAIGNGVPLAMGRAIARAVKLALNHGGAHADTATQRAGDTGCAGDGRDA